MFTIWFSFPDDFLRASGLYLGLIITSFASDFPGRRGRNYNLERSHLAFGWLWFLRAVTLELH